MNDLSIITEYKKLLKKGLHNISIGNNASLEDHLLCNKSELNTIKIINNYVYTTYSTNHNDKTYSIDLFILSNYSELLINKLKSKNYWFMSKDYGTNNIMINIDKELNNSTYKDCININKSKAVHLDKNYWKELSSNDNTAIFERDADTYFLSNKTIEDFKKNLFLDSYLYRELSFKYDLKEDNINYDLLIQNISYFIIEDPIIERKTLYYELLNILKELVILDE